MLPLRRRSRFLVALAIVIQLSILLTWAWIQHYGGPQSPSYSPPHQFDSTTRKDDPQDDEDRGPESSESIAGCESYTFYSATPHDPQSAGQHRLPYQRPGAACRTFQSSEVESVLQEHKAVIQDPDLYQLFQNAFPNTLDTAIKWRGTSQNDSNEELAFIVTGDIDAMWIRDAAFQLSPYSSLITASDDPDSLASLFRGNINLQARYITYQPWCNSYTAPEETGFAKSYHGGPYQVTPHMDMYFCYTPNFELDSFGAFLLTSYEYFSATKDTDFFGRHGWVKAVKQILEICIIQMQPFYNADDGSYIDPTYTFSSTTTVFSATLGIRGLGNPVNYTGMIKTPFRPSDDAAIFQFNVPVNMMISSYLAKGAEIMEAIDNSEASGLAKRMRKMSRTIRDAIEKHGVVPHPDGSGKLIYAFEVDGFGGRNLMDDANLPSLLSAPLMGYVKPGQPEWETYLNTRNFVNSPANPWFIRGPQITGIGSPHTSVGTVWPMALITTILTSDDDEEIISQLKQLVSTAASTGLIHESQDAQLKDVWTRPWFAWANSLFGQMVLDLSNRKPHILAKKLEYD